MLENQNSIIKRKPPYYPLKYVKEHSWTVEKQTKAYGLGILAVIIWSTVASAFKLTLDHMDPPTMVVLASIFSTISLFLVVLVTGRLPKLFSMKRGRRFRTMLPGALNPFIYYLLLFYTYDILKAQEAQALNYTWPIILTVLSIIVLGQKIKGISIAAILISFIGVLVITTKGGFFTSGTVAPIGIALGLANAVVWSTYWVINLRDEEDGILKLFLNFLFGTVLVTIFVLIFFGLELKGIEGILGAGYIGIFEMGITFVIWLGALKLSRDTSKISNLIYLSPFISLFLIALLVGEGIMITTVIGLVLISAGIILQRIDDKRRKNSTEE
jgi:drug/metabolite transporter (DMT)-like permease